MPSEAAFYSVNEVKKPRDLRVYHNNSACLVGRDIPQHERKKGTAGYGHCDECAKLNRQRR
ncbi:MAG TPA: hypothetical protein VGH29_00905 [Candidatus Binataceae bacterium]